MEEEKKPTAMEMLLSKLFFYFLGALAVLILICAVLSFMVGDEKKETEKENVQTDQPKIITDLLTPNQYSRSQRKLEKVNGIVIHYTANPKSSAKDNRDYFENLKNRKTTYASSHFVVGLQGEIIQCIPLDEIAYASNNRNSDTISIEVCHVDPAGKFEKETYQSLVELTAWLCGKYDLKKEDIIRHYDVTGKMCPKYYVKHPKAWKKLKKDVFRYMESKKEKLEPVEGDEKRKG